MPSSSSRKSAKNLDYRLLIDIVIRIALALFFAFAAGIYGKNVLAQLQGADFKHLNAANISHILSVTSVSFYTLMIATLYVLRLRPKNKFAGIWPTIAAVAGGFMMFGLIMFKPNMTLPLGAQIFASCLVLTGNIFMIFTLYFLGRSFSILPESRKLVTEGPYKIIRHPLYLAEFIAILGTMIFFLSPGAVALVIAQTTFQLVRMHYEERVLTKNFPEYKNYAKRTARIIPGIY